MRVRMYLYLIYVDTHEQHLTRSEAKENGPSVLPSVIRLLIHNSLAAGRMKVKRKPLKVIRIRIFIVSEYSDL